MGGDLAPPAMVATQDAKRCRLCVKNGSTTRFGIGEQESKREEELHAARVDLASRDFCAHLLVPLNECRRKSLYMPWACGAQRHAYEKCEYFDYKRRVALKEKENEAKKKEQK